jgi:hypothetical protein
MSKNPTVNRPIARVQKMVSKLITLKSIIDVWGPPILFKFCKCSAMYAVGVNGSLGAPVTALAILSDSFLQNAV